MEPIQDAHELLGYLRRLIFNIIPNLVPGDIITIARESQGPLPSCFKTSADVTWSFVQIALLMHSCLESNTELEKSSPKSARNCCPSSIRISTIPTWTWVGMFAALVCRRRPFEIFHLTTQGKLHFSTRSVILECVNTERQLVCPDSCVICRGAQPGLTTLTHYWDYHILINGGENKWSFQVNEYFHICTKLM